MFSGVGMGSDYDRQVERGGSEVRHFGGFAPVQWSNYSSQPVLVNASSALTPYVGDLSAYPSFCEASPVATNRIPATNWRYAALDITLFFFFTKPASQQD